MNVKDMIASQVVNTGGVTLHGGQPVNYRYGYQVALYQNYNIEYDITELDLMIENVSKDLQDAGIWYDEGKYIVDSVTVHITDFDLAMSVAKFNKQKAIYDWSNNRSVEVK